MIDDVVGRQRVSVLTHPLTQVGRHGTKIARDAKTPKTKNRPRTGSTAVTGGEDASCVLHENCDRAFSCATRRQGWEHHAAAIEMRGACKGGCCRRMHHGRSRAGSTSEASLLLPGQGKTCSSSALPLDSAVEAFGPNASDGRDARDHTMQDTSGQVTYRRAFKTGTCQVRSGTGRA